MSLWSRLFGAGGGAGIRNESATGAGIARWFLGAPVWTPRNYAALSEQAFITNAIGFRCTKLIAGGAASVPLMLMKKKAEIEEHPLLDLLAGPGPMIGGRQLLEAFFAYLLLEGNSYLEAVAPFDSRPPKELWALRPDRMRVIPGSSGLPQKFQYQVNGDTITWTQDQITGRGPILHFKEFHPLNDWYGLSRSEPALYGIDRHNEASRHNKALLQNGARPSGALIFKPVVVNGEAQNAPPEIIEAAERRLEDGHVEMTRRGRPMVLGGDIDWKEMGLSPKDMDFAKGKDDAARDICSSFGVPHELVVPGGATFNNRAMARLELYESTILPLFDQALEALNQWLTPRYGDGLRLVADLDGVSALEPRRESLRAAAVNLYKGQVIKRDEARQLIGYDAIGGAEGESFFVAPTSGGSSPDGAHKPPAGTPDQADPNPDAAARAA